MLVKQTKPFITYDSTDDRNVFFFPGVNTIADEDAAILAESETFQQKVKCGLLQIITQEAAPATVISKPGAVKAAVKIATKVNITNMSVVNAIKTIEDTFNRDELNRLAGVDQRKGVQDAIKRQLEKIKLTPAEAKQE